MTTAVARRSAAVSMATHRPDRMRDDPVIAAVLEANGVAFDDLEWFGSCFTTAEGTNRLSARPSGPIQVDLRRLDGSEDWLATAQINPLVSYHAQRGHRSVTLRRRLPEAMAAMLPGRPASDVVDAPGFDRMKVVSARVSPDGYTDLVIKPIDGHHQKEDHA